ncbi:MAG: DUF922 domain-containing protein [Candidatus Eremiobacteraeota bacterium]|nr:DUF922 domain-containing protein [Candidatus Eremiobacteraeota bacterium]
MPALILASLAATAPPETIRYDVRHFSDCKAAAQYAAAHATIGHYFYRLTARLGNARIERFGAHQYRGRGIGVLSIGTSQLDLPRWTWPGMSPAQRSAYNAFVAAIRAHERGHETIARNAVQQHTFDLTVLSSSAENARHALRTALEAQLQQASSQLLQKEQLYDRVTLHGRRQSDAPLYGFPGGDDVLFSCP